MEVIRPKYKLSVTEQQPYSNMPEFCRLALTFANTREYADGLLIGVLVLDGDQSTVDERDVFFETTLPGKTNEQDFDLTVNCSRVRQLTITTNAPYVEPNMFEWDH